MSACAAEDELSATPGRLTLTEEDRRILAEWAADCAERTLPLFEVHARDDRRPRQAIEGARAFARGEMRIGRLRALATAAHAAARAVDDPAAVAAARAAGHAAATAHMAAHARGAAGYAALAAGRANADDPAAAEELLGRCRRVASPAVRAAFGRLPPPPGGGGILGSLLRHLVARFDA